MTHLLLRLRAVRLRGARDRHQLLVPPPLDGRTFDPSFIPANAIRHYDIELHVIRA